MTITTKAGSDRAAPPIDNMSPRNRQKAHALGLTSATGLVIGSIVGTGVFTMPAVLAGAGTMGIVVLASSPSGPCCLAVLFGQLTKRVPNNDGGLYAYSRHEFGDFAGYLVGWCYWIQAWAGNAAIVASWVFYVDALFDSTTRPGWRTGASPCSVLWVPAAVNLAGVRQMAWFQNVTVVLKFLPLLFVGVVGWFFVHPRQLRTVQRLGRQPLQRHRHRGWCRAVLLHRRRGGRGHREAGAEPPPQRGSRLADRHRAQRHPVRAGDGRRSWVSWPTTPWSTPARRSSTPSRTMFPHEAWAGQFIAALAVISGIGALNGWTLIVTETSRAIAQDDLFPRPFTWADRKGTAWFGIVIGPSCRRCSCYGATRPAPG